MLSDACFDASYSLTKSLTTGGYKCVKPDVASKVVDAMFNLYEVQSTIHMDLNDEMKIEECGRCSTVQILIQLGGACCSMHEFEADEYIDFIVEICKLNLRLEYAFYMYRLTVMEENLEFDLGEMPLHILNKVCEHMRSETH